MAVYRINGVEYELPDDLDEGVRKSTLQTLAKKTPKQDIQQPVPEPTQPQGEAPQAEAPEYTPFAEVKKEIEPEDLLQDPDWRRASTTVYELFKGTSSDPGYLNASKFGRELMSEFNYSITGMGVMAKRVNEKGTPEQKRAFLYLMDQFEEMEGSTGGFMMGLGNVLSDPTTYIGGGVVGAGALLKQSEMAAIRESLKQGLRTGAVAGTEGAIYGASSSVIEQGVEVSAGRKEEVDNLEVVKDASVAAVVGFGAGTVLGAVVDQVASKIKMRSKASKAGTPEEDAAAMVATAEAQVADDVASAAARKEDTVATPPEEATTAVSREADTNAQPTPKEATGGSSEAPVEGVLVPKTSADEAATGMVKAADDVVEGDVLEKVMGKLRKPARETEVPYKKQTVESSHAFARELAEDLRGLHYTQVEEVATQLRVDKLTIGEGETFAISVKEALDSNIKEMSTLIKQKYATKDAAEAAQLSKVLDELDRQRGALRVMDEALASQAAASQRWRQEGLTQTRKQSREDIMEELNVSKEDAEVEFAKRADKEMQSKEVQSKMREYDSKISAAHAAGKTAEAARLSVEKHYVANELAAKAAGGDAGLIRKYIELSISNVFTTSTIMINVASSGAKMLYRPVLKALVDNPFEAATRRELTATYSAMKAANKGALRAALASFKFEQAILTGGDPLKYMEGNGFALKGSLAGFIRFFPRVIGASDEYLARLTYEGFLAGNAAGKAVEEGTKQGLKGKALDAYVDKMTKEAVESGYLTGKEAFQQQVALVMKKGENLGLEGKDLGEYVGKGVARHGEEMKIAKEEMRDYVQEVLFKTRFKSKKKTRTEAPALLKYPLKVNEFIDDTHEGFWQLYEKTVDNHPILRVLGQLFMRTPVRVFEEGMRMTPGVQVITPHFMNDLVGRNGRMAQVRAQGEALVGLGLTGTILSLYANGQVVGDGAYSSWKQQRNRTDSDLPEPYTIRFDDGSTWNYRYFDPIATPVKIVVNALERMEVLEMRKQQGEFINQSEWDNAMATISVGTGAITQAFRDANLMSGLDGAITLIEDLKDPEKGDAALLKFIGEKLRVLVPNTIHKFAKVNDPSMDDPVTFEQIMRSRVLGSLGVSKEGVPKSYDVLGNVREIGNPMAMWNIFSTASPEQRKKGLSERELDVLRKLDYLSKQTGAIFTTPYKHPMLPGVDLRTMMTSDGKETLYDRWNKYYRQGNHENALSALLNASLPVGTMSINAAGVTQVNSYITKMRNVAFARLLAEESGVSQGFVRSVIRKGEVQTGLWDQ